MDADWLNFKVVRAPTNGAMLSLPTSCIAAGEKFESNKRTLLGGKELAY